ncbi:uncharacterized protein EHS24_004876 [Apiotrichum porosum]|uniref:Trafficking protein particle complex subunit 2-like protein n=1 Tax=Apiotrichum porosum TaxID=105984 RepID=A0A427Y6B6_9TREE|nr:uncharacterized protein EHS24_004876 [Apiotrichum porosum]RSH86606.1 hypothetical protein EHS24_004876 [Apiotrichum porosum]
MDRPTTVPLHLTSLAILAPSNAPLYVHAFTGKDDELRAYHLAHAAVDVIEERIVVNSSPNRPADSYLGLLFCMEDMAFYGFQTNTKLRIVLSVALVDAPIKDADIVAIFRVVHQLILQATHNPFISLPATFKATPAPPVPESTTPTPGNGGGKEKDIVDEAADAVAEATARLAVDADGKELRNEPVPDDTMFACGPDDLRPEWFQGQRFTRGVERLGDMLSGARP